jgi:beta-phosphoglucomutase-like phosphatase (HAD superfamily)
VQSPLAVPHPPADLVTELAGDPDVQSMPWSVVVYIDLVLFDAAALWTSVSRRVLSDYRVETPDRLPDSLVLALSTGDLQRISAALTDSISARTGTRVTAELVRLRIHSHLVRALGGMTLHPSARTFLHRALSSGAKVAFLSSMPRSWVRRLCEVLVLPRPHLLLTGDEVCRGRPDPYGYLLAVHQLGIPARYGVAVDSGADGIKAAMAAGYKVMALVPKDMTGGSGRLGLVGDLSEIDLGAVHSALQRTWQQEQEERAGQQAGSVSDAGRPTRSASGRAQPVPPRASRTGRGSSRASDSRPG